MSADKRKPPVSESLAEELNEFVVQAQSPAGNKLDSYLANPEAGALAARAQHVSHNSTLNLQRELTNAAAQDDDLDAHKRFEVWLTGVAADDNKDLRGCIENFMADNQTPLPRLRLWLEQDAALPGRARPRVRVNEDLRNCLESIMQERERRFNFAGWAENNMAASPTASSHMDEDDEDAQSELSPLSPPQTPLRVSKPGTPVRGFTDVGMSPRSPLRTPMTPGYTGFAPGKGLVMDEESAVQKDAATEEAAQWGSTEDRDFVTPWYTYAIRTLMPPLGCLIFYFIFWRCYNYPRSGIWWSDACAWCFIISEAICYLFAMTHWVWMWNLKFRKRVTMRELNLRDEDLPTVDIMIPCYSEPTEIVEMTVRACWDMDYPAHKITCWVCDDGKKEDMKNMVAKIGSEYTGKMGLKYVARIKTPGVPHHAKAGNLNNCILKEPSSGQLIIILDCDMLPEPCMARVVAPFFFKKLPLNNGNERQGPVDYGSITAAGAPVVRAQLDNTVGLLQTPQAFYNLDSHDLLGQSYGFFYECLMSGWDGTGCTPCCGTGVTFNRYALEKVGGFSTGSITEDFKTSLNLCANGFQCKYFLQRMTRGVSPKELNAFMVQRLRWAVGAIQIVLAGNPLLTKGLHYRARWLYFFSTVGIVYIIPVVVMGTIMYSTILAGAPISFGPTSFEQYLIIGGSSVALMMLMQFLAGWRLSRRDYMRALQDNFTVFMTLIRAILIGFCGMEMGFAVTNKDVSFDLKANLYHAMPHIIVYLFSGAAMLKGCLEMAAEYGLITIFWTTGYNVSLLYFSLLWTFFIWVMVSGPPRMVLYGYLRSRREARSEIQCTNGNVPALQELPSTPMNTFPPLSPELWRKPDPEYVAPTASELEITPLPTPRTAAMVNMEGGTPERTRKP